MSLSVEWERVAGEYCLTVKSEQLAITVVTPSLPLASKLTTMLLELEPRAFEWPPVNRAPPGFEDHPAFAEHPEPPTESDLPPAALADADDNVGGLKAGEAGP